MSAGGGLVSAYSGIFDDSGDKRGEESKKDVQSGGDTALHVGWIVQGDEAAGERRKAIPQSVRKR